VPFALAFTLSNLGVGDHAPEAIFIDPSTSLGDRGELSIAAL
jgi:hypothetical protein